MNKIIANPPLGIYKNPDIHAGQAFYLVQLDAYARVRKEFFGQEVKFPTYAFNVYGKRGDLQENPQEYANIYRKRKSLRERLDLCSEETVSDDEPKIVEGIKRDFLRVYEQGFMIFGPSGECYLDIEKIRKRYKIEEILGQIKASDRVKNTLERYWNENMHKPHAITKPTRYSIGNPLEGKQNIGPLFTLANLWDHKYGKDNDFLLAGSEKNLTNYIFLRMLTQLILAGNPVINQIFVYPQLRFKEGIENWDLETLTLEENGSDFLRYAYLATPLGSGGSTNIDQTRIVEAKSFVNKLINLSRVLPIRRDRKIDLDEASRINDFQIDKYVRNLKQKVFNISRELSTAKTEEERMNFSRKFSDAVEMARVITPKIYKKIKASNNEQ